MTKPSDSPRKQRTISSALWAAYGDALGFPTELAQSNFVVQRIGTPLSLRVVEWRRLVGGRFGAQVDLCKGAYSDDTQLRLATSRAIREDGYFDVESFAKIELPVWLSYCLGAGRGSKAAASSLGERQTNWFSNFYSSDNVSYVKGGGNGAAMRVQPHVWAATDLGNESEILAAVVRNAICTHGHVRGIAGAMVHAVVLARIFRTGKIPPANEWQRLSEIILLLPKIVAADSDLSTFWLSSWERESQIRLTEAATSVASEWVFAVQRAIALLDGSPSSAYANIVEALGGFTDAERGSGLKSALFALAGAWLHRDSGPRACIESIANLLNSDTDTIASMAGALIGALPNQQPLDDDIQDRDYLEAEAIRLFQISQRQRPNNSFAYPDLLYWQPPKSPLDAVGTMGDDFGVYGLGRIAPLGDAFKSTQKSTVWQWFLLDFGQTVLCKRRVTPKKLPPEAIWHADPQEPLKDELEKPLRTKASVPVFNASPPDLFSAAVRETDMPEEKNIDQLPSVDDLTDFAIRSDFDPKVIGDSILRICNEDNAIELAIAFAAIVVKAKKARLRRKT